jgi:hypothetical protein
MIKNSTNINKTNNCLSPKIIKHKQNKTYACLGPCLICPFSIGHCIVFYILLQNLHIRIFKLLLQIRTKHCVNFRFLFNFVFVLFCFVCFVLFCFCFCFCFCFFFFAFHFILEKMWLVNFTSYM